MNDAIVNAKGRLEGLAASVSLALLFLAGCVWRVYHEIALTLSASKITASIDLASSINSVLSRQLAAFALSVLAVHIALGLTAWGLTRLTIAALPHRFVPESFPVLIGWTLLLVLLVLASNGAWFPASRFASEDLGLLMNRLGFSPLLASLLIGVLILTLAISAARRAGFRPQARFRGLVVGAATLGSIGAAINDRFRRVASSGELRQARTW